MVVLLLCPTLEHVKWCTLGAEQHGTELELTLDGEVFDGGMLLPIIRDALVEAGILILSNIVRLAHPYGFHVVEMLPLMADLLDLLRLLLLLLLSLLVDFLDLWLVIVGGIFLIVVIIVVVGNLLLGGCFFVELDGETAWKQYM